MKKLPAYFFATLLAATAPLRLSAQEAPSAFGLTPARPDSLLPEGQAGLPLIPESMPPLEEAPQARKPKREKQSATTAAEDALRSRIKLRQAKTKAQSDPELQALWDSQFKARTDYEQRAILTEYYTRLWARIAKIDKTINKEEITAQTKRYISNYAQTRIAPTEPPAGAPAR